MGQSIDCQPHFGHQLGRRKASYTNHAAQVGEKTAVCLLSDRLLALFILRQTLSTHLILGQAPLRSLSTMSCAVSLEGNHACKHSLASATSPCFTSPVNT